MKRDKPSYRRSKEEMLAEVNINHDVDSFELSVGGAFKVYQNPRIHINAEFEDEYDSIGIDIGEVLLNTDRWK